MPRGKSRYNTKSSTVRNIGDKGTTYHRETETTSRRGKTSTTRQVKAPEGPGQMNVDKTYSFKSLPNTTTVDKFGKRKSGGGR